MAGSVWYGGDAAIEVRRAPYKLTFMSIQPLIVSMAPQDPDTVIRVADEGRFVNSLLLKSKAF